MKFATDKSHRDYFYKHGIIEFDGLFTLDQIHEMNVLIDKILAKRLAIPTSQLIHQQSQDIFIQGHDLFRQDEVLKKILLHRRLAETALELTEARSARMGYDTLLVGKAQESSENSIYDQYLSQEGNLQEKSSMTPIICGLMLCLEPPQSSDKISPLFSQTAGNAVYFKPDIPLELKDLLDIKRGRYLLMAYVDPRTVYILNNKDPHTHTLKHLGYVFGDKLSDTLNPLIVRSS